MSGGRNDSEPPQTPQQQSQSSNDAASMAMTITTSALTGAPSASVTTPLASNVSATAATTTSTTTTTTTNHLHVTTEASFLTSNNSNNNSSSTTLFSGAASPSLNSQRITTASLPAHRPWQYNWKRPQWNVIRNQPPSTTTTTTESAQHRHEPLFHTSVAISRDEARQLWTEEPNAASNEQQQHRGPPPSLNQLGGHHHHHKRVHSNIPEPGSEDFDLRHAQIMEEDDDDDDDEDRMYVLTVTLLTTIDHQHYQDHSGASLRAAHNYADAILLEVVEHQRPLHLQPHHSTTTTANNNGNSGAKTKPPTTSTTTPPPSSSGSSSSLPSAAQLDDDHLALSEQRVVVSKLLRWPESALQVGAQPGQQQHSQQQPPARRPQKQSSRRRLFFPFGRKNSRNLDDEEAAAVPPPPPPPSSTPSPPMATTGLVSAALCRPPPPDPYAQASEALDVVQLLSLFGGGEMDLTPAAHVDHHHNSNNSNSMRPPPPPTDRSPTENQSLVLCCLHSSGLIYVYSLEKLLADPQAAPKNKPLAHDDFMDGGMAALLLGDVMVQKLQTTYVPLTEPLATIPLEVPLLWDATTQATTMVSSPPSEMNEAYRQHFQQQKQQQALGLNASIWDTTVDGPSFPFRTKDNVPTLILQASDLLCVAGPGRRMQRAPVSALEEQNEEWGHDDDDVHGQAKETATLFSDRSRGSTAAFSRLRQQQINQARKHPKQNQNEAPLPLGGFITFFSLRTLAPVRTVYLPFCPLRLTPTVWGCLEFVLVIGADPDQPGQPPQVVALRLDTRSVILEEGSAPPPLHPFYPTTPTVSDMPVVNSNLVGAAASTDSSNATSNESATHTAGDIPPPPPPPSTSNTTTVPPLQPAFGYHHHHLVDNIVIGNSTTSGVEPLQVPLKRFQIVPLAVPRMEEVPALIVGPCHWIPPLENGGASTMSAAMGGSKTTVPPSLALLFLDTHSSQVTLLQRLWTSLRIIPMDEVTDQHPLLTPYHIGTGRPAHTNKSHNTNSASSQNGSMVGSTHGNSPSRTYHADRVLIRIETMLDRRHVTCIPLEDDDGHGLMLDEPEDVNVWCHQGQGWSLVGIGAKVHFVCWEGATTLQGAYSKPLGSFVGENDDPLITSMLVQQDCTSFLHPNPVQPFSFYSPSAELSSLWIESLRHQTQTLVTQTWQGLSAAYPVATDQDFPKGLFWTAIESISNQNKPSSGGVVGLVESPAISRPSSMSSLAAASGGTGAGGTGVVGANSNNSSVTPRRSPLSHEEKSERLLQQCSSWTVLEQTDFSRLTMFGRQVPMVTLRTHTHTYSLSLRSDVALAAPTATTFQQVLSWLADKGDYFTAASLALDLLKDTQTLRHLWRSLDKIIDMEDEVSRLVGLLDGVQPIDENNNLEATLVRLSDMTVGCLTKGGYAMSSTLRLFLSTDPNYDATRASLMLAATTAKTLSGNPDLIVAAMGNDFPTDKEPSEEELVWPVRCLLQVGVARETLSNALLLLNATIPDELRHRRRSDVLAVPSMSLCKSLISLVLSSSNEAAKLLLRLVDDQTGALFWDSLEQNTQLALATIRIENQTPLLREEDVRSWVLRELRKAMENEVNVGDDEDDLLPSGWLRKIAEACLINGGCDVNMLQGSTKTSFDDDDRWGILKFTRSVAKTREILAAATGPIGIDYDILVSALLLLHRRDEPWSETPSTLSTEGLLNAACHGAGRRTRFEPTFPLDEGTLMRLSYIAGNVQAGANLVGGEDGLVLECSNILVQGVGLDMEHAEALLLSETYRILGIETTDFVVEKAHIHLLALLEEHVVGVRKYGDFQSSHHGTVDPVFAAKICLRTWLRLNSNCLSSASEWMVAWLKARLEISDEAVSRRRLACAAFVRALLWPNYSGLADKTCLAELLRFPNLFVVQLSRACCGLVEAVPDEGWVDDLDKSMFEI